MISNFAGKRTGDKIGESFNEIGPVKSFRITQKPLPQGKKARELCTLADILCYFAKFLITLIMSST